ncbi:MAG: phage minor head protein [Verrucomicrobia bacterium]|nr:phage minor head protein [Verrucomicrobiota bacterium]
MPSFLLKSVPNKEAVKFLAGKPAVTRKVFDAMLPEVRARLFTAATLEHADAIARVRELAAELPAGGDWNDIKGRIADEFSPHMVDPSADAETRAGQLAASNARAELVLRTNAYDVYDATQTLALDEQRDVMPDWQWHTVGDENVRASHEALDGKVLPANSPFWDRFKEWGCRCWKEALTKEDTQAIRDADADKHPDDRRVLEGAALQQAEAGQIAIGPETAARMADKNIGKKIEWSDTPGGAGGGTGTFDLNKGARFRSTPLNSNGLAVPIEGLRAKYDAATYAQFETMAKATELEPGVTLLDWLNGMKLAA